MTKTAAPAPEDDNEEEDDKMTPTAGNVAKASWNFSTKQLRENLEYAGEEVVNLLVDAFLLCRKYSISKTEFAAEIDVHASTVSKIFNGRYTDPKNSHIRLVPSKKFLDATRNFIAAKKAREAVKNKLFIETPTARRIWTLCDLSRESHTPAFIWGASHIGKTFALKRYAEANNHTRTIYIRMKAASGLGGMVHRICDAAGQPINTNNARLIELLKGTIDPGQLLIFDEIHQLQHTYRKESFFACLEVIREILDEVECGGVICGTNLARDRINKHKKGDLEQLLRRGVHRLNLGNVVRVTDMKVILSHYGLPWPSKGMEIKLDSEHIFEPLAELRYMAGHEGLKALCERIRYAEELAKLEKQTLDWKHVADAHFTIMANATYGEGAEDEWDDAA
ncbi:MAG: ATP-binding protein [Verrucomicrobiota bacterium]